MAATQPKQGPFHDTFSSKINKILFEKKMTPSELATQSGVSKATISRLLSNKNYKGKRYQASLQTAIAVLLALRLDKHDQETLLFLAFPEFLIWRDALEAHDDIDTVNNRLYDAGLPMLTHFPK